MMLRMCRTMPDTMHNKPERSSQLCVSHWQTFVATKRRVPIMIMKRPV